MPQDADKPAKPRVFAKLTPDVLAEVGTSEPYVPGEDDAIPDPPRGVGDEVVFLRGEMIVFKDGVEVRREPIPKKPKDTP